MKFSVNPKQNLWRIVQFCCLKKTPHIWETQGVGTKDVGNFVNVHSIAVLGAIFAILEARSNILDNCNTQK